MGKRLNIVSDFIFVIVSHDFFSATQSPIDGVGRTSLAVVNRAIYSSAIPPKC